MSVPFIKKFQLKFGDRIVTAKDSEITYVYLQDQGFRSIARVDMVIDKTTLDHTNHVLTAFGDLLEKGYQILIHSMVKLHHRNLELRDSKTAIRTEAPYLLAVYDSEGNEVKDQEIIDRVNYYLGIRFSFSIEVNEEFNRQSGRTTSFLKTVKDGDKVLTWSLTTACRLAQKLDDLGIKAEIISATLSEAMELKKVHGDRIKIDHDFYEFHKINVGEYFEA